MLFILPVAASANTYIVTGAIFTATGASGTATTSNSFAGMVTYHFGGGSAEQASYPDNTSPTSITDANGSNPASFAYDVNSPFSAGVAGGNTLVAVAETRPGVFGWTTPTTHVYFERRVVNSSTELSALNFSAGNSQILPAPTLVTMTSSTVQLQWTGLVDPSNAVSSYSIYRATFAPPASTLAYAPATANVQMLTSFPGALNVTDSTVAPNTTYFYTLAPNFRWTGGPSIGIGANGVNKDYYTTFGQSVTLTVTTPLNPAVLSAFWTVPSGVSLGQIFTVSFTVSNVGDQATLGNVTPTADPVIVVSGSAVHQTGPVPVGVTIAPHTFVPYQYTYLASASGIVSFSATASDGASVSVTAGSSAVSISPAAQLVSSMAVSPGLVYVPPMLAGLPNIITVYLTVTNTGGSIAIGVSPAAAPTNSPHSGTGPFFGAIPLAISSVNLTPGASATFTWSYSAIASGSSFFQGQVQGTDQNTGQAVFSTATASSDVITATDKLTMSLAYFFDTSNQLRTYSLGEPVTITVNLNNNGALTANNVSATVQIAPLHYGQINSGSPAMLPLTVPAPVTSILTGNAASFTFSFSATATGQFFPGAHAQATTTAGTYYADRTQYDGGIEDASPLTFVTPASLTISSFTTTATQYTVGQWFTVAMTVANSGGAFASAVLPVVANSGTGGLTLINAPFAAVPISPFSSVSFTWTYSANASGGVNFTGSATGLDGNFANHGLTATVSTQQGTIPGINIFLPAVLSVSVDPATPATVTQGQIFSVIISVSNSSGGANAVRVSPDVNVSASPSFPIHLISSPSPIFLTLAASATAKFTWTYSLTGGPGTATFSFLATGIDSISGQTITAALNGYNIALQTAAQLNSVLSSLTSVASVGNLFTLSMSVSNSGQASAQVFPSTLLVSPGGPSAVIYSLNPSSFVLTGGQTNVFTYTFSAVGTGIFGFSGNAIGTDLNTHTPVSSAGNQVPISILNPVVLNAGFDFTVPTPILVTTGQTITIRMNVNNTAPVPGATSLGTHPLALNQVTGGGGAFSLGSGPTPASSDVINFGSAQFTFIYTAGASPGTVTFSGRATGTDQTTGFAQFSNVTILPTITIQQAGALASDLTITPGLLTPSGTLFAYLTVTNTGGTTVNAVVPTLNFSPAILSQTSPAPTATPLTPGASTTFSWVFAPTGTGILNFTVNASGIDAVSGLTKTAGAKTGGSIIRTPANLNGAMSFFPSPASTTQPVTLIMTVTNTGEADAISVAPILTNVSTYFAKLGTANPVLLSSGPNPAVQGIPGLSSRAFTFIYSVNGAGNVAFSGGARGTDSILQTEINSVENASNFITVQNISALTSSLSSTPTAVNLGSIITVTMTISNTGGANATAVRPRTPLVAVGTGGVLQLSGPPVTATVALSPGGSAIFTFTYTAQGLGTVNFSGNATGTDQNSGFQIQSPFTQSNDTFIRNDPVLNASLAMFPATVDVNQLVTVVLSVTNVGQGNANNVAPSPSSLLGTLSGTASVVEINSPSAVGTMTPGASALFTWVYQPTSAGFFRFSAKAQGVDTLTLLPVSSTVALGNFTTVQAPPVLQAALSLQRNTVNASQNFEVYLTVTNTGGAGVVSMSPPASLAISGSAASLLYQSGPAPANAGILGGATQVFTWVYQGTAVSGTAHFSATASGFDANNGLVVSGLSVSSSAVTVQSAPSLSVDAYPLPSVLVQGSVLTLRLTVTNSGAGSATVNSLSVTALTTVGTGTATVISAPAASSVTLTGGSSSVFTYTFSATGAGTLNFSVAVAGADSNNPGLTRTAVNLLSGLNQVVVVPPSPNLVASFSLPLTRTVGQNFQIIMTVSNTGLIGATNVTFTPSPLLAISPGGALVPLAGPSPAAGSVNIGIGAAANFTWTYSASLAGVVTVSQSVVAFDGIGSTYTAAATVLIQTPAKISSFFSAQPSTLNLGSSFTLVLTVSNSGQATASGVYVPQYTGTFWHDLSSVAPLGSTVTAGLSRIVDPVQPLSVPGGGSATFTFTYLAGGTAPGVLVFSNSAVGTDANSGLEILAVSDPATNIFTPPINIQRPAVLVSNFNFAPAEVNIAQQFTLMLTLTNTGGATILNLRPNPTASNNPINVGSGGAARLTGPLPVPPVNLTGGASVTFTWTYSAASAGVLNFSLRASGTDSNVGTEVALVSSSNSGDVHLPTVLTASAAVINTGTVSAGFPITVVITVQNTAPSSADAVNTSVTAVSQLPAPIAVLSSGPLPVSQSVPSLTTRTFTYIYLSASAGTVTFSHTVQALNPDTNQLLTLAPVSTAPLTVNPAATLISAGSAQPTQASVGQLITFQLSVTNTGGANALSVTPAVFKFGTAAAGAVAVSSPVPVNIASGGAAALFQFTYSATTPGTLFFSANATGTDSLNTSLQVSSNWSNSNVVTVQPAGVLSASFLALPAQQSLGGLLTVVLSVTNTGGAIVNGVSPALTVTTGSTGVLTPLSVPSSVAISGGASVLFTYTFSPSAAGIVQFTSQPSGTDANSGSIVSAGSLTSTSITLVKAGTLSASLTVPVLAIPSGQVFTVRLSVSNGGGASVSGVNPSLSGVLGGTLSSPVLVLVNPGPVVVPAGATTTFTYTYSVSGLGTVGFTGLATGTEINTAGPVTSNLAGPANVVVSDSPTLSSFLVLTPTVLTVGQVTTLRLVVSNTGVVAASNLTPSVATSGAAVILLSGPSPAAGAASVAAGGGSTTFTYTFSATAAGSTLFSGSVGGVTVTAGPVYQSATTTASLLQQSPPTLLNSFLALPGTISVGQPLTVLLSVTNTGQAAASLVNYTVGSNFIKQGNTSAISNNPFFGPAPASATLAGGASQVFTLTFSTLGAGTVSFHASAEGFDQNSGAAVSATAVDSSNVAVQSPAALSAQILIPVNATRTQAFSLVLRVSNTGLATANGVAPSTIIRTGSGSALLLTGPVPASSSIAGGAQVDFAYTFTASGSGTVLFSTIAVGTDANSGGAIQSPAAQATLNEQEPVTLSISSLTASPASVGTGAQITVLMQVQNAVGSATAVGLSTTPFLVINGVPTLVSGAIAANPVSVASLAGGSSSTFTYLFTAAQAGTLTFSGQAFANDANQPGITATAAPLTSNSVTIFAQGALSVSSFQILPAGSLSTGQQISVVLAVVNNGQGNSQTVTASALSVFGASASLIQAPLPVTGVAVITPTAASAFTYIYQVGSTGTLGFSGSVNGFNTVGGPITSGLTATAGSTVFQAASLTAGASVSRTLLSTGQVVTMVLTVTNTGVASAVNTSPAAVPLISLAGLLLPAAGPGITATSLVGGTSTNFTYVFTASQPGTGFVAVSASATDQFAGTPVNSPAVTTTTITVQNAAQLSASLAVSPTAVFVGSYVTVRLTISNQAGAAQADNVSPTAAPAFSVPGTFTLLPGGPIVAANLAGGASLTFTYTYSAAATGNPIVFTAQGTGADDNSLAAVFSPVTSSGSVQVVPANAILSAAWLTPVAVASVNQAVTGILQVTNQNTLVSGSNVVASSFGPSGTASAQYLLGPVPASVASLAPGAPTFFTYVYRFTSSGTGNFTAFATGSGGITPTAVTRSADVTVQTAPALAVFNVVLTPTALSMGQTFSLIFSVSNFGQGTALTVTPQTPQKIGSATPDLPLTGPFPASASLAAGQTAQFTFTGVDNVGGLGGSPWSLGYAVQAQGYDVNTGSQVLSSQTASNGASVYQPAALSSALGITTTTVDFGQVFNVVMSVTNSGDVDAVSVQPSALTLVGTGGAFPVLGPSPASQTVLNHSSANFTWTYSAVGAGTFTLQGNASGTDQFSSSQVSSTSSASPLVDVQAPAALAITSLVASPASVGTGSEIMVRMTVNNSGQATAVGVTGRPLVWAPAAVSLTAVGILPGPVTLLGGASQVFTYRFVAGVPVGSGIVFTGRAGGFDINGGATITSGVGSSSATPVSTFAQANLSVVSLQFTPGGPMSVGQLFGVSMTVANSGQGTANAITPSTLTAYNVTPAGFAVSTPLPAPVATLLNGNSTIFYYTVTATSAGQLGLQGTVSGFDNAGNALTVTPGQTTYAVDISSAASLSAVWSVTGVASVGQTVTAVVTITNNGQATATGLTVGAAAVVGGGLTYLSGPTGAVNATLTQTASTSYTYTFFASSAAVPTLTVTGTGTDANSLTSVTTGPVASAPVTIHNASLLTATMRVAPSSRLIGQIFTVYVDVSNALGSSDAQSISVAANPTVQPAGGALFLSVLPPVVVGPLAAGASATFTYTYSANAVANPLTFSATVLYQDAVSSVTASASATTNSAQVVSNQPILSASFLTPSPSVATQNQNVTAVLVVTNQNLLVDAFNVSVTAYGASTALGISLVSGVFPAAPGVTLLAGTSAKFTYVMQFSPGGTANFTAVAQGSTGNAANATSTAVTVQTVPALAVASINLQPSAVSLSQAYTLIIGVSNSGGATALAVVPSAIVKAGTANVSSLSGPTPLSATVVSGNTAFFTYTGVDTLGGAGGSPWNLAYIAQAQGYDANTGTLTFTAAGVSSNYISITTGTNLTMSLSVSPTVVDMQQPVYLDMTVTNTGDAMAFGVLPSIVDQLGTGGFALVSPSSQTPASISKNASVTFHWTYSAVGTGTLVFSSHATGTDVNSGAPVSTPAGQSQLVTVQVPSILVVSNHVASPSTVGTGQPITTLFTVTNIGQAAAVGVSAVPALTVVNGPATYISGPTPALIASLGGGASATFTYVYSAPGAIPSPGVSFSASATGLDANNGLTVTSGALTSNGVVVVTAAALTASYAVSPSVSVSVGGALTVVLHVANTGAGAASVVSPTTFIQGGTATLSPSSVPSLTGVGIASGGFAEFTYTFSAAGAGTVFFSMAATGTDALGVNTSNVTVTSAVLVQVPATLSGVLAAPLTVDTNQAFNLGYLVTNTSGPTGEAIHSLSPTVAGAAIAGAGAASGPVPVGVSLVGGASANFFYSVTAPALPGLITLTVAVTGTAANTGLSLNDTRPLQTVLVQSPAAVTLAATANPSTVNLTQLFTLTLNVSNTGQATLNAISPSFVAGGAGAALNLAAPGALGSLAGGANANFQWTFSATGIGQRDFTLSATGFDANTGATVTANVPVSVNITALQAVLSTLSIAAPAVPGSIAIGGNVTLTVQVTNTGLQPATNVSVVVSPTAGLSLISAPGVLPSLGASGATAQFTFTYSGTVAGLQSFSIQAWGSDPTLRNSVVELLGNTVAVHGPPTLSSFITPLGGLTVSVGQQVTLVMTVSHTGAIGSSADVINMNGNPLAKGGNASIITPMTNPVPANLSVTPQGTQYFTYVAVPDGVLVGGMYFIGNATGFDANTGAAVSSVINASVTITVQTPAVAATSGLVSPATVTNPQTFTTTLTVTNTGGAPLNNLTPFIAATSGGQPVVPNTGPSPASASLTGGASVTFTWTFDVIGASPNIRFSTIATGVDGNSGAAISTGTRLGSVIVVQSAPSIVQQLDITNFTATPHAGCDFNDFNVILTVTNTGTAAGTAAINYPVPDAPVVYAAPGLPTVLALKSASAVSNTVLTILGGSTRRFTWTYSATASSATFDFSSLAVAALEANTGATVNLPAVTDPTPYTLTGSPQLSSALSVVAGNPMASGQVGTVILTVTNTGSADAVSITPGALSPNPTGAAGTNSITGPVPALALNVLQGTTVSFTWTFTATAALGGQGTLNFATSVGGLGQPGACQTLANVPVFASPVSVVSSVTLSMTHFSPSPFQVVVGQPMTLTVNVQNQGAAVAQNVSLTSVTMVGTASGIVGTFAPASVSLGATQSQVFTYTFTPTVAGTVQFLASGAAYDQVSNATVTASAPLSTFLNVRNPVSLTSSVLMVSPQVGKANRTQVISVVLTVSNAAAAPGDNAVALTATVQADPNFLLLSSPGVLPSLAPGVSQSFIWTYSCTLEGFYNFTANASARDSLTSITFVAAPAVISGFEVTTPTALLSTTLNLPGLIVANTGVPVTNGVLSLGTGYKLTFTVRNNGLATAAALTPSAALLPSLAIAGPTVSPANVATLAVGSTTTFTWTFTPTATGLLSLTATVNATTQGTSLTTTAQYYTGLVYDVQNASLTAGAMTLTYSSVSPGTIAIGSLITVRMSVTNTGGATAFNVSPVALPFNTSPLWLTFTPAVLDDSSGFPVGAGLNLTPGATATFRWVFTAMQSSGGPYIFSVNASGLDPLGGALASAITFSPGVVIGSGPSLATYLASSLVRLDGNPLAGPYGIGQLVTLRLSVSNTAGAGSYAFVNVTPGVTATGTWSTVSVTAFSYVTATGSSTLLPLSITPGTSLVMDVVLLVSQTAVATGSADTVNVTLRGLYYDANYSAVPFSVLLPISFAMNIQAATVANNHPVVNEFFLSANTFFPPTQSLGIAFSVATSGQAVLRVYNISGELVKTLFDDQVLASSVAGQAILYSGATDPRLIWDGTAGDGQPVSSGTYMMFLDAPGFRDVKKVNLIR